MIKDRFDKEVREGSEVALSKIVGRSSVLITALVLEIRKNSSGIRLKLQQTDQSKPTWYNFDKDRLIVLV